MFRLSTSFALFVLIFTLTVATQQASGLGAAATTSTTSTSSSSSSSSNNGGELITPKPATKLPGLGTSNNEIPNEASDVDLIPRKLANKNKTTGPDSMDAVMSAGGENRAVRSGRIVVKFRDEYKVRCSAGIVGGVLTCASTRAALAAGNAAAAQQNNPIASAISLVNRFSGTVQPAINKTEKQLAALEIKASSRSGKAQPDLAGYMFITVPPSALSSAAEAFNELDCVEFAQVDYLPIPAQCPDRDLSLQKGPGKEGADIGINCQISTDALGAAISCPPPGPIFCALVPVGAPPVLQLSAFSLTGGLGAITCSRPSRWTGYNPQYTANPPPTPPATTPPGCTIFTEPGAVFPPTWDCQQGGCNLGGGLRGRCVEPPTGFTSVSSCQYGCRNSFCAEYLATTLGWSKCIDQLDGAGWDSICATLANIYCPTIINSPTPYNNSGGGGGAGMPQVDLPTETCFGVSVSAVAQTYAFDDTEVFDACFSLRGPAFPLFVGTRGVLKFTDIGNGDGIRPWGFTGAASAFAFPFLNQTPANLTDIMTGVPCNNIIQYSTIRSRFLAGGTLNSNDPTLPESAGLAEYDNAFKSFPFALSHNCFTAGNATPGCTNTKCCVFVCINDSSCCSIGWDASCVTQAQTNPDLCQTGGFESPVVFTPPLPNPGIPNFDPVEIDTGATVNFRARNLALFRTKQPNVLSASEYISAIQKIASGSLTASISTANSLHVGVSYQIFSVGTSSLAAWQDVGAPTNTVGTIFTATKSSTTVVPGGTGVATANAIPGILPVAQTFAQAAPIPTAVTSLTTSQCYRITTLGTTTNANWIAMGASTATVGTVFIKKAIVGVGTGTATLLSLPLPLDESYDFVNSGFSGGGIDVAGMRAFTAGITRDGVPIDSACILGSRTQVGVIDYSAIVDHLDLLGQVTVETGQTIVIPAPGTSTLINPDHGTAVLGVLVAADNGFGITGLLPRAHATFFPAVTSLQGGRVASALVAAGEILGDGDVLCIPLEYGIGYTLATDPFVNELFNVIDSLGATIVIPAGNGGFKLQTFANTTTAAIVVGSAWPGRQIPVTFGSVKSITSPTVSTGGLLASSAVFPGEQYCRYPSSNWSETVGGGLTDTVGGVGIDVAGWGTAICTLGIGTLYNNATSGIPATPQQNYQASFGQTSGACAMIAGLVGALNGFSEEVFDGSIGTQRIRYILNNFNTNVNGDPVGNNLGSVITQCGYGVGVEFPSTISDAPNVVSNGDNVPIGGTQHNVGGFPLASVCLENVFINESYPGGTPFGMQVITGTRISGNKFSIGTLNNKFLQIQAQQKGRGSRGSGYGPSIQYVSMGLATDVQIRATLLVNDISLVNDVAFEAYGLVTGGSGTSTTDETGQAMGIMYAYNRKSNRWAYLDFGFLSGVAPTSSTPNLTARLSSTGYIPQDFVVTEGSDNVIYTRFITFGFGVIGPYRTFWDQILIQLNPPAGIP